MADHHFADDLRLVEGVFRGGTVAADDGQLARRFAVEGDEAAFAILVERHGPMVLAVCRGVLRNPEDARDAFQATFLVLAKKVGSIRAGEALASWLHRVAYRMAIRINAGEARRRGVERRAAVRDGAAPPGGAPGAAPIRELHEEIDRLPEKFRLPIVLCHLEDLTHAQAAEHLGWTVGMVRGRVARARELLRGRLARRGLAPTSPAAASAPGRRATCGAVPASLVLSTVRAARASSLGLGLAAGSPSTAILLSEQGVRAMSWLKLKAAAASVGVLVTLAAGTYLVARAVAPAGAGGPGRGAATGALDRPDPAPPAAPAPASLALDGRVLDPDGRPVGGASVRVLYVDSGAPDPAEARAEAHATTDAGGRYEVQIPRAAFGPPGGPPPAPPSILASAAGFGPVLVPARPAPGGQAVALVRDDVPIEGRVVDLAGEPVAGASVRSTALYRSPGGNLGGWLAAAQARGSQGPWAELEGFRFEVAATTGPDGRFRLAGLGRETVAALTIAAPSIATAHLYAMTRGGRDVSAEDRTSGRPPALVYHAARFDHVAGPTRPVVGTVRDAADGRPLPGVRVVGIVPRWDGDADHQDGPAATTDVAGRYRLAGLPVAPRYRLFASPPSGQPYPNVAADAEASPVDPGAATGDISLRRGVLVRGRLTDKETGRPVRGRVLTFSFPDNPMLRDFPRFAGTEPPTALAGADGRFEVAAPPGRGLIVAGSGDRRYLPGAGAATIRGLVPDPTGASPGTFPTVPRPCSAANFQAYAAIDPGPGDVAVTQDLQFDPGRPLRGTVIAPDGRPLAGTTAGRMPGGPLWETTPRPSADFEVVGIRPGQPRRIYFFHQARKLAGSILVDGTEAAPLVVKLEPWGVLSGRIVVDDDRPRSGLILIGNYLPQDPPPDYGMFPGDVPVDAEGRFRIEGLVPGLRYEGRVADRPRIIGSIFKDLRLTPGETRDLADVKPSL